MMDLIPVEVHNALRKLGWRHMRSWEDRGLFFARLICGEEDAHDCKNAQGCAESSSEALGRSWRIAAEMERIYP